MKTLKTILSAAGVLAIAALAMVSCSKDESAQAGGLDRTGTISVSVSGLMGKYSQDEGTKTGLVSNVRVSWEAGDKVYAFDGSKCLGELNVSLKDGKDYYALLTGDLLEPAAGTTKITLVYASGFSATQGQAITDGKLSFDISSQSSGSDSKNTPFVAFGTLDYTEGAPSLNEKVVDFTLATSVMRLNCTGLEASAAITGAKLKGMSNNCVLNVTDAGAELVQGAIGNISLSFADGFKASASGAQVIYAGIAKNGTANTQSFEVTQSKTYEWNFGSKTREACKSINAICQLTEKEITIGPFTVSESSSIDPDAKQIIFAPGNMYWDGDSFEFEAEQWYYRNYPGHTDDAAETGSGPKTTPANTCGSFFWFNYANMASSYAEMHSTASDASADDIFFTNGQTAETNRQANPEFTVNGEKGKWRTLTNSEWKYLIEVRKVNGYSGYGKTCCWATVNGVSGLIIFHDNYTGETSKLTSIPEGCVFLPASGYRTNKKMTFKTIGYYCSSKAYFTSFAYALQFNDKVAQVAYQSNYRIYGEFVRLVSNVE